MLNLSSRLVWIDVLKGIAITAVVLGHHPNLSDKTFNIIFSFHIPLFFFISGYLFNADNTCCELIRRRFDSILKPYLFTAGLISVVYVIFKNGPFFLWYFFWIMFGNGPNLPKHALHLWFLPSLFATNFAAFLLLKNWSALKHSWVVQIIFIATALILGVFLMKLLWAVKLPLNINHFSLEHVHRFICQGLVDNPAYLTIKSIKDTPYILKGLPWSLDIILLTTAFFISGYAIRSNNMETLAKNPLFCLAMFSFFIMLHCFFNYTIDLNERRYDHVLISTILAFAGIFCCLSLALAIDKWDNSITVVFKYLGKYSMIIFIFHPLVENKLFFALMSIYPGIVYISSVAAFTAGIILPLVLNCLVLERFKFFRFWYYA